MKRRSEAVIGYERHEDKDNQPVHISAGIPCDMRGGRGVFQGSLGELCADGRGYSDARRLLLHLRKKRLPCVGACDNSADERTFGNGADGFCFFALAEALLGDNHTDGDILRARDRVYGRRFHGAGIEFLLRAGCVDSLSDAGVGTYGLFCGYAGQVAGQEPNPAAYLQRGDRRFLLAADGLVQLFVV